MASPATSGPFPAVDCQSAGTLPRPPNTPRARPPHARQNSPRKVASCPPMASDLDLHTAAAEVHGRLPSLGSRALEVKLGGRPRVLLLLRHIRARRGAYSLPSQRAQSLGLSAPVGAPLRTACTSAKMILDATRTLGVPSVARSWRWSRLFRRNIGPTRSL
jgi:hypothetical protein